MAAHGQPPVRLSPSSGVMIHDGNETVAGLIPRYEAATSSGASGRHRLEGRTGGHGSTVFGGAGAARG
jgi:hypothetical protein